MKRSIKRIIALACLLALIIQPASALASQQRTIPLNNILTNKHQVGPFATDSYVVINLNIRTTKPNNGGYCHVLAQIDGKWEIVYYKSIVFSLFETEKVINELLTSVSDYSLLILFSFTEPVYINGRITYFR
ncbi:MAG TPA: hypothetical protein PK304_04815 [Mobilitalea sp.]|nr:hypothetical protein [Mobilitalea sp.]